MMFKWKYENLKFIQGFPPFAWCSTCSWGNNARRPRTWQRMLRFRWGNIHEDKGFFKFTKTFHRPNTGHKRPWVSSPPAVLICLWLRILTPETPKGRQLKHILNSANASHLVQHALQGCEATLNKGVFHDKNLPSYNKKMMPTKKWCSCELTWCPYRFSYYKLKNGTNPKIHDSDVQVFILTFSVKKNLLWVGIIPCKNQPYHPFLFTASDADGMSRSMVWSAMHTQTDSWACRRCIFSRYILIDNICICIG